MAKDRSHAKNIAPKKQKESYKWIESSINSKQALAGAREVIIIQDREGDIYEQLCMIPDERTHLLIRAKANRILSNQTRLFEHLAGLPKQGDYQIILEGDKRKGIKKRTATIEVRFGKVTICRNQYNDKSMPEVKELYAIEAREVAEGIEKPIVWRLLTTLRVEKIDMALLCIEWYTCRWIIEEVFRILKKKVLISKPANCLMVKRSASYAY